MIKWLLSLRKKRNHYAEVQYDYSYKSGYDWAAGVLMRGEMTPQEVEDKCDTSSAFHEGAMMKSFDTGAQHAIDVLVEHGVVEENRSYNLLCRADTKCPRPVPGKTGNVYPLFSEQKSPQ